MTKVSITKSSFKKYGDNAKIPNFELDLNKHITTIAGQSNPLNNIVIVTDNISITDEPHKTYFVNNSGGQVNITLNDATPVGTEYTFVNADGTYCTIWPTDLSIIHIRWLDLAADPIEYVSEGVTNDPVKYISVDGFGGALTLFKVSESESQHIWLATTANAVRVLLD